MIRSSVVGGHASEGVEIIGEDGPSFPDPRSLGASEARSSSTIVAFEMGDPALAADPVASEPPSGVSGWRIGDPGDEGDTAFGLEQVGGDALREAGIERGFAQVDAEIVALGDGFG